MQAEVKMQSNRESMKPSNESELITVSKPEATLKDTQVNIQVENKNKVLRQRKTHY